MKFTFGDIVVVENNLIGVVVKMWQGSWDGRKPPNCDVYVRNYNSIKNYENDEIERYLVMHKELDGEHLYWHQRCLEQK